MAIGPGKYDEDCTAIREKNCAAGAILIVFDGDKGTGFSCQAPLGITARIPSILRSVADDIEKDMEKGIL